jgi:7-carboxy-7-deazaguanine synthase
MSHTEPDTMSKPLRVVEVFHSVQGEGVSAGEPATFLRLAGCNLACRWCDTPYSWNWKLYDRAEFSVPHDLEQVLGRIGTPVRLIVTGGEPLLQAEALERLLPRLAAFVEVETNGTVAPTAALLQRVNQWNVSPKLENSGETLERRLRLDVLERFAAQESAWLKLVVRGQEEAAEVEALIDRLRWSRERVLLQADASTRAELDLRGPVVAAWAKGSGFRYSPRLHIARWNGERGR